MSGCIAHYHGLGGCISEEIDHAHQRFRWILTADFGVEGIACTGVGFTGLAGLVADLALDVEFEGSPTQRGAETRFTTGLGGALGLLADGQLKLDIAFFNDDVGVGNRCQQRDLHLLGDSPLIDPLFIGDGFVVVKLNGDGLAILNTHAHKKVGVRLARGDLRLNHRLQGAGDHSVQWQGIHDRADQTVIDSCH
ncbi:hypothetical protein D3C75_744060 [compost metagenome]